jgi:hypothetical protein
MQLCLPAGYHTATLETLRHEILLIPAQLRRVEIWPLVSLPASTPEGGWPAPHSSPNQLFDDDFLFSLQYSCVRTDDSLEPFCLCRGEQGQPAISPILDGGLLNSVSAARDDFLSLPGREYFGVTFYSYRGAVVDMFAHQPPRPIGVSSCNGLNDSSAF